MSESEANAEMLEGYFDGLDPDSPAPSANRSASYAHGFANGRADRIGRAAGKADDLRIAAERAMRLDASR